MNPDAAARVAAAPVVLGTLGTLGHAPSMQHNVLLLATALGAAGHVDAMHRTGAGDRCG